MANHTYTCLHGTFLCNNDAERVTMELETRTISLWSFLHRKSQDFINHLYDDTKKHVGTRTDPECSNRSLLLLGPLSVLIRSRSVHLVESLHAWYLPDARRFSRTHVHINLGPHPFLRRSFQFHAQWSTAFPIARIHHRGKVSKILAVFDWNSILLDDKKTKYHDDTLETSIYTLLFCSFDIKGANG